MEWISEVFRTLAVAAVTAGATWAIGRWRARRAAAQWTLEKVAGEEWTLRRDSPRTAFDVHVWSEGDLSSAGTVRVVQRHERFDIAAGRTIDITGVRVGSIVIVDWIERDQRLVARARIRESTQDVTLQMKDASRYITGW